MKKNKLLYILFNIIVAVLFAVFYMFNNIVGLFIANIIVVAEIVARYKISLFSLKSIIINYITLPLIYQYFFNNSYGLLELKLTPIYYSTIILTIFAYNIITLLFLYKNDVRKEENEKLNITYSIEGKSVIFLCLLAIACCIIAFPTLPFSYDSSHRFEALLPGNAWNHVVVICLIFMLGNIKSSRMVQFTYLFSFFWFLSHYERVDVLGILCLILFIYFAKQKEKIEIKKVVKFGSIIAVLLVIMLNIGYIRGGYKSGSILKNVLVQTTASDIAYVYNISIDYKNHNPLLKGSTYKQYIYESIPLLNYENSIPKVLSRKYPFPGGEFLLSAPIMNFGVYIIPLFALIENIILTWIIKSKNKYLYLVYLFVIAASFRINWYGLSYIETGLIYIIPFLLFAYRVVFRSLVFKEQTIHE